MGFWRPAHEQRGDPFGWMNGKVWKHIGMSFRAALSIYSHICIVPMLFEAANDRDHIPW
jgi:hypothetical protein